MNLPLFEPNAAYRQGGSGRGELPAWQTFYEARDNLPPEQMKNIPPFRTMFPQELHGAKASAREARIRAISDAIRTAGGLGVLSAALGAGRHYADRDASREGRSGATL
jgi:hypothetical protein